MADISPIHGWAKPLLPKVQPGTSDGLLPYLNRKQDSKSWPLPTPAAQEKRGSGGAADYVLHIPGSQTLKLQKMETLFCW